MADDYIVPISKAKRGLKVTGAVIDGFSEDVYKAIFAEGLKSFLNKNMSKIKIKDARDDEEELEKLHEDAFEIANANLQMLVEGEVKKRRGTGSSKEPRAVVTRARQIARERIKATYRAAGKKLGMKASELTAFADELIADEDNQDILEQARKDVAEAAVKKAPAIKIKEGSALAAVLAEAEDVKPRGEALKRAREAKAAQKGVVASKATAKPTHTQHARQ